MECYINKLLLHHNRFIYVIKNNKYMYTHVQSKLIHSKYLNTCHWIQVNWSHWKNFLSLKLIHTKLFMNFEATISKLKNVWLFLGKHISNHRNVKMLKSQRNSTIKEFLSFADVSQTLVDKENITWLQKFTYLRIIQCFGLKW